MQKYAVLLTVFCICVISFWFPLAGSSSELLLPIQTNITPEHVAIPKETEVSLEKQDKILFAGDIMLARDVETIMKKYGADYPYQHLSTIQSTHEIQIANFEGSIPDVHQQTADFTFKFSVDAHFIDSLNSAGFTHLSLANNHSFDFGRNGYEHTQQVLSANSIQSFGAPYNFSSSSIVQLKQNNREVVLIGIDQTVTTYQPEELRKYFESLRDDAFVVVLVHWGEEYQQIHSKKQEKFAKELIAYGADLIVGHHPHVVQDIGVYDGVAVFYSLGNFIFDQYFSESVQQGLLLSLEIDQRTSVVLIPVTSIESRGAPRPLTGYEKEIFLKNLAKKSDQQLSSMIEAGSVDLTALLAVSP